MRTLDALRSGTTRAKLLRALWLLMLAVHTPAVLRCLWGQSSQASQDHNIIAFVGLLLACVFFVLKVLDLPWLRFKTDRRSLVTLALAMALAHANLMRYSGDVIADPVQPLVIAHILMVTNLVSVRRALRRTLARLGRAEHTTKAELAHTANTIATTDRLLPQFSLFAPTIPRAPPLCT
ncbi:MAG: hypothetical protein IID41_01265 [Planctomycetes bacterium]|nr:hypothetical protein [Planctomycetota bacterium]